MDIPSRIRRIQRFLGQEEDGLIGPDTLTAIERALFRKKEEAQENAGLMTLSRKGLDQLVAHEISSENYYKRFLCKPVFPGGMSGCTIGIGYDLGYNSSSQIARDWQGLIADADLARLQQSAGVKGDSAKTLVNSLGDIRIPLAAARQAFFQSTLPRYARLCQKTFNGVGQLPADAQAGLLSLIYNRGGSVSGSARKEMKAIQGLVPQQDLAGIAEQILAMRRLWENKGLDGLLRRREDEAALVEGARRRYRDDELVRI